ncbi:MAG: ferritin [Deltaproteobacteria bacterium]|nr:ferritin [Deltaproteobacteria bacterium]
MISPKMLEALNTQINEELYSAYLYLAMSTYCDSRTFKGFGAWLRVQFTEEQQHALKLIDHVLARGGQLSLKPIAAPPAEYGTITQVFESVLGHERHITERVHKLHELAIAEKDVSAQVFMQWYVTEQVEEEANASEIVEKLKMVGDRPGSALYLDKEYGKRGK